MKTQIIKIIPCLLAGFILSACVGAVNLPAGTIAESNTEKTESAPIVLTPEAILINKCIIGNTAQADPACAKVVADTNGCITNPFLSGCEANPLFTAHVQNARDERVKFCNDADNKDDNHCTGSDSVKDICKHDSFSKVCDSNYNYAREVICKDEPTSERCLDTIITACGADPFITAFCFQDNTYNKNRESECSDRATTERCATTVSRVCESDPFNTALCFGGNTYHKVRETTCVGEPMSVRCKTTVSRICDVDALDVLCNGQENYYSAQERICNREINSDRCAPIVARVCSTKLLDYLCHDKEIYFTAQEMICERSPNRNGCYTARRRLCNRNRFHDFCYNPQDMSAREIICADEPNSDRCAPTVAEICGLNIFDSLCNKIETYHAIQKTRCAREPNSERCALTVAQVCVVNPFNSLCDGNETYYLAKETTCASEPRSDRCAPTLDRVCGADVFGVFCQSVNLTLHDILSSHSINQFAGDSLNVNCDVTLIGFSDDYYNYRCHVNSYPSGINIKPLNDSNTGTAIYAGSVIAQYHSNRANPVITKNIDIIADFDNNTLSYSGNLVASNNYSSVFSINGNFTDRGILTGKVNLGSQETNLRGLIGQDEVFGVFASESVRFRGTLVIGIFAGGFTATRQK